VHTSLGRKLLLSTAGILAFLLCAAFLLLERYQAEAWADHLYSQSLAYARIASPELLKRFRGSFPPDAVEGAGVTPEFLALNRDLMQFMLMTPSGRRLYVSPVFPGFTPIDLAALGEENLDERLAGGRTSTLTRKLADGRRVLDLLEPTFGPTGQQVLAVRYLISFDSVDARVAALRGYFLAIAGAALLLCLLLVGLAARRIVAPIEKLTNGARAIAGGDLATRIPPAGRDELGTLAQAFNDMAASLALSQAELTGKHAALSQAHFELREMQEQLLRSERLAAIGQLAAGVSHEIDNPVGIILGLAELLLEETPPEDPRHADLLAIVAECRRCKRITGGLLGFARPVVGHRDQIDLVALVEDTVESLRPQKLFREVAVELAMPAVFTAVSGDPDHLRQVLVNLLLNAAQALPGRGRIVVTLSDHGDAGVELSVEDDGPGIPPEERERIFLPFVSTKAPGEGTGLGLALCRKLIEADGGTVTAAGSPLGGARFLIWLPAAGREKYFDKVSGNSLG
jgi:signal transduction histidine kinase